MPTTNHEFSPSRKDGLAIHFCQFPSQCQAVIGGFIFGSCSLICSLAIIAINLIWKVIDWIECKPTNLLVSNGLKSSSKLAF